MNNPYQNPFHQYIYGLICEARLLEAHDELIALLAQDDKDADCWQLLGLLAAVQHDLDTAATLLDHAAKLAPDNPLTLKLRGQIELEAGRAKNAVAWFGRARALAPEDAEITHALAVSHAEAGNTRRAAALFEDARQLAARRPAMILNNALFLIGQHRDAEALAELDALLQAAPLHPAGRIERIRVLNRLERHAEAIESIRAWLAQRRDDEAMLIELAETLFREKRLDETRDEIRQIATRDWNDSAHLLRAVYLLGQVAAADGKLDEAEPYFLAAAKMAPQDGKVRLATGEFFLRRKSFELAFTHLIAAHGLLAADEELSAVAMGGIVRCSYSSGAPDLARAFLAEHLPAKDGKKRHSQLLLLVGMLIQDGLQKHAEEHARMVIEEDAANLKAYEYLARCLLDQGKDGDAFEMLIPATRRFPRSFLLHFQLSIAALRIGEYPAGLRHARRALRLNPDSFEARGNLAVLLAESGQPARGFALYDTLMKERRDDANGSQLALNRSLALMAHGRMREGLEAYVVRHRIFVHHYQRYANPIADYAEPSFAGKKVLLIAEQGIGDEILFLQFLPEILAEGAICTCECSLKLLPLFRRSFPQVRFVTRQQPLNPLLSETYDCQIALGDLMIRHFLKRGRFELDRHGFLVPDALRKSYWRDRLAPMRSADKPLAVGVAWRSRLQTGRRKQFWPPLEDWLPLLRQPGVNWIVMQYDHNREEIDALRKEGVALTVFEEINQLDDIDEVAALAANLDLVISAPVSVPMIAGAVGTTSWVFHPRFGWSLFGTRRVPVMPANRPFIRSFRQPWATVVAEMATALEKRIARQGGVRKAIGTVDAF